MKPFSDNALKVLRARYLLKNEKGEVTETVEQLFKRVASVVAQIDKNYGASKKNIERTIEEFFALMIFYPSWVTNLGSVSLSASNQ